ncbi:hypothetical protein BGZ99_006684 [Dissophora globulifera]|uniref:Uncharacterized protein n=1 Tax=Dissophora globulifera TaxID=979702 RepID=A0A9P6RSB3_9FUNG|nr:hypothetical protein BGZ99_006684 [Dissophora globulifera]
MAKHSIIAFAFFLLAVLATLTTDALPAPQLPPVPSQPFRFDVSTPLTDTLWLVDSLPTVAWDTALMPEGSTLDIALLHHEKKQSILLRRYVPARVGFAAVNLRPEITPGTYSLLLTVFKGRTSTVIGRSFVQSIILVDDESIDPEEEAIRLLNPTTVDADLNNSNEETKEIVKTVPHTPGWSEFSFKRKHQNAIQDTEVLQLTHQPKGNLVLRAPYTIGWTIPKALENARRARVNLLLVDRKDQIVRILATNIDAKAGFIYVFLPEDTPLQRYQIKVEIIGKGRKFSGYTHTFFTSLPAFSART